MIGTTAAQYVLSMPITSVGSRVSLKVVKPARSANRAVTVALRSAELRDLRAREQPLRHVLRQVRPEELVDALHLPAGGGQQGDLVG